MLPPRGLIQLIGISMQTDTEVYGTYITGARRLSEFIKSEGHTIQFLVEDAN
jgi:hypothetical protein